MWLTNLAPEIQEAILSLPRVESGPDTVKEIDLRWIDREFGLGCAAGEVGLDDKSLAVRIFCVIVVVRVEINRGEISWFDRILSYD